VERVTIVIHPYINFVININIKRTNLAITRVCEPFFYLGKVST